MGHRLSPLQGPGVMKPVLLPFMLAPSVLSIKLSLADPTDAARARLRVPARMLLTNVPRAVASAIPSSKVRTTVLACYDVAL